MARPTVLGISGSPVKNSNTDRAIRAVLEATGLPSEFVKLSTLNVRPCIACLGCAADNICKVKDDFPALAEKVRAADALVVGGHIAYGSIDAFTKAFLERLFSLRHQRGLNRGKIAVVVVTGIGRAAPGLDEAAGQVAHALGMEGMAVLGEVKVTGNPPCMTCGFGETCPLSALPRVLGEDTTVTPEKFMAVERQPDVCEQAAALGAEIARRLRKERA